MANVLNNEINNFIVYLSYDISIESASSEQSLWLMNARTHIEREREKTNCIYTNLIWLSHFIRISTLDRMEKNDDREKETKQNG